MSNEQIEREIDLSSRGRFRNLEVENGKFPPIHLSVPATVYPPREDTRLLITALDTLRGKTGRAVEIGVGAGAISMALAQRGWKVTGFDINPFAVAAARGNIESNGFREDIQIEEGGPGEIGWKVPNDSDLVVWNLPYLNPPKEGEPTLGPMEEASLTDYREEGGWSRVLREILDDDLNNPNVLVVLLFRSDPASPSHPEDWTKFGWASRKISAKRTGGDTLEVRAFWKPGGGCPPTILNNTDSTMEDAKLLPPQGWQRILAKQQNKGRGRRSSKWTSEEGDFIGTWAIDSDILQNIHPGLLQTTIGSVVSQSLGMQCKWPNDLMIKGIKSGGILLESSTTDDRIRIGIGVNRKSREVGGRKVSGWEEIDGSLSVEDIFLRIDGSLASLFATHERIIQLSREEMETLSWKAISESLSRGVISKTLDEEIRITGIEHNGGLKFWSELGVSQTEELQSIVTSF